MGITHTALGFWSPQFHLAYSSCATSVFNAKSLFAISLIWRTQWLLRLIIPCTKSSSSEMLVEVSLDNLRFGSFQSTSPSGVWFLFPLSSTLMLTLPEGGDHVTNTAIQDGCICRYSNTPDDCMACAMNEQRGASYSGKSCSGSAKLKSWGWALGGSVFSHPRSWPVALPHSPFLQEKMDVLDGPHPGEDISNLFCVFYPIEKQSNEVNITANTDFPGKH